MNKILTQNLNYPMKKEVINMMSFSWKVFLLSGIEIRVNHLPYQILRFLISFSIEEAENRHEKIESLDSQKPFVDIFSGIIIFPIVYYHAKYLEMDRWLNQ